MTKYPLSAIKSYFLLGHQVQIQLVLVLDQKLNFMAQNTISGKKIITRQLTNVLIPTNIIFNV